MIKITTIVVVEEVGVGQIRRQGWVSLDLTRILHAKGKHANIQMRFRFISSRAQRAVLGLGCNLRVLVDSCARH